MISYEFTVCYIIVCRVVSDDSQVFHAFLYNSVDDLHCAANAEESCEHNSHAVLHFSNGFFQ